VKGKTTLRQRMLVQKRWDLRAWSDIWVYMEFLRVPIPQKAKDNWKKKKGKKL